ncbi:N-acetylmuramoyl-L-alanine amidase [Candidatus Roizmanbacteria bacterium]|nr:N-acetylmuramoyl-L-alanine amidase [Candidatus Roizmanbacteria bacterium]
MTIKRDFILHRNSSEEGRQGRKIELLVLHSMDGFYKSTVEWFKNPKTAVVAHYLISKKGEISQMLKDGWAGYHAGDYETNLRSIGIELEDEKKGEAWVYPKEEIKALRWLVKRLCKKYKIPKDKEHILLHKDITPERDDPVGNFDLDWIASFKTSYLRSVGRNDLSIS